MANAPPTFGVYSYLGHVYDANIMQIERNEDFSLDLARLERALDDGAKLLYIASPNNPTGNTLPRDQLERLLAHDAMIVVDEAYAEFTGESFVPTVEEHANLIVVRTFSKWAGLAGMRAGYAVFPPALAEIVWNTKVPFNLTVSAEQAILASLEDRDWLYKNIALIVAERERLFSRLSDLPWLRPYPSHGNFILCEVRGPNAEAVRDSLAEQGIMIRYFDVPGLRNCIRISVGKPEDSDRVHRSSQDDRSRCWEVTAAPTSNAARARLASPSPSISTAPAATKSRPALACSTTCSSSSPATASSTFASTPPATSSATRTTSSRTPASCSGRR